MIRLHHTGFVVKDIAAWEKNMLFENKIKEVIDPIQKAKLALYSNFSDSFIELIQPLEEDSFTMNALLKSGNHFNHFCYHVDSIEEMNEVASKYKLIPVLGPVPALLFDNEQVAFFYGRNRQIVEFLISTL